MITKVDEFKVIGATLLSIEEAEKLPQHLRVYPCWWWLRSPGTHQDYAARVNYDGSICYYGNYVNDINFCVRPALKLKSSNLEIGDKFEIGGIEFEVISDNLAFCMRDIGRCAFREDWEAQDANAYETSDVRQFVEEWFKSAVQNRNKVRMGIGFEEMGAMVRALKTYCSKSDMFEGDVSILSLDADSSILRGMQTNRRINIDVLDKNGTRSTRLLCIDGKIMNADEYYAWKHSSQ